MVGRPSWMAVRGWKDLPEVWEGSGGYHRGPGEFGRHFRRARRFQKAFQEGWEVSGGPSGGP